MLFPNKLFSYEESILSWFPVILSHLEERPMSVSELFLTVRDGIVSVNDYIDVLDCLYALGKVEYDDSEGVLRYVV